MDAGGETAGAIMPHHGALEHDFFFPAHEIADEAAEGGVLGESVVLGGGVCGFEELDALGLGVAADALEGEGVVGGVEDAVAGFGVGCQEAGGGYVREVAEGVSFVSHELMFWEQDNTQRSGHLLFAHRKDVFPREKIFKPDVPVAVVSFPHLLERGPKIDRLHPADGGRVDIPSLAGMNSGNIDSCFVVIVQR